MRNHVILTKDQNPDVIILHYGTNDLRKTESVNSIASNILRILEIAASLSTDSNAVIVSCLTPKMDQSFRLNEVLKSGTSSRNIGFVDHSNIDGKSHLNRSNIHLNRKGSAILARNFDECIKS